MKEKELPRVSEIIAVLQEAMPGDYYLQRGAVLHQAISLYLQNKLDENTIDKRIKGFFDGFKVFIKTMKIQPLFIEKSLKNDILKYTGTIDLYTDKGILIDFKTNSIPKSTTAQLGGYTLLLESEGYQVKECWAVCLLDNSFRIEHIDKEKGKKIFLACLSIYHFKKE